MRAKNAGIERINKALGEFLIESGRVEFKMLLLIDRISEAPIEHLFDEASPLTFGAKVKWFKKWCDFSGVSEKKMPRKVNTGCSISVHLSADT
jgi:hypothetical protein